MLVGPYREPFDELRVNFASAPYPAHPDTVEEPVLRFGPYRERERVGPSPTIRARNQDRSE
jgi:hypothetical protein